MQGLHRSPVNSQHKGEWLRALLFSLICAWINDWVNNRETGDLRHHCAHYVVTVMKEGIQSKNNHKFLSKSPIKFEICSTIKCILALVLRVWFCVYKLYIWYQNTILYFYRWYFFIFAWYFMKTENIKCCQTNKPTQMLWHLMILCCYNSCCNRETTHRNLSWMFIHIKVPALGG